MIVAQGLTLSSRSRSAFLAALAAVCLLVFAPPLQAADKPAPEKLQAMVQCLIGCKKGDTACQKACVTEASSPAYAEAAGTCASACADALAVPGQTNKDDLLTCVQACE